MTPIKSLTAYLATLLIFLVTDLIWLGLVTRDFYQKHLGHIPKEHASDIEPS